MTTRNAKLSTKLKLFSTMRFKRFVKNDLFPGIIIFSVLLFLFDLSQSNFRLGYKTVQFSNGKSSQPVLQYDHEIVPSVHIKEKELNKFKDVKKSQRDMSNPKYDDITDTDILKKNKRDFNQKKTEISHKNKNVVNSDMLMYNRIPKTGSETLTLLINVLSKLNDYKHRQSTIFNKRRLNEDMQRKFVHEVMMIKPPFAYDRHVYFTDFSKFGHQNPLYINTMRDPVEKVISRFFYWRSPGLSIFEELKSAGKVHSNKSYWLSKVSIMS
ncbi:uncharacterized protein LOC143239279 isoform X2 [Tachypleus tridentatus]|uniref:uncharacterized protein LOC143239279 isoform X2 n=1 Tax=Tachypleus tridentatus TaxID=6853 RepID=UPI003FD2E75E